MSTLPQPVAPPEPAATARIRIPELDGWRAVAVLAVLSFHATIGTPLANPVTGFGWVGVDLFFVLSGYLITGILLDARDRPGYFQRFYARRSRRIFPLYFTLLALYIFAALAFGGPQPWSYWGMHAAFLSSSVEYFHYWGFPAPAFVYGGVTVLWSLSIEEQFYLFWAPVVRWLRGRALVALLGIILLGAPLLRVLLHQPDFPEYRFLPTRFDAIAWGAALCLWLRAVPAFSALRLLRRAGIIALIAAAPLLGLTGAQRASVYFAAFGYTWIAIAFATLLGITVLRSGAQVGLWRVLRWRTVQHIGRVSYGLYLVHYPMLLLLAPWVERHWGLGAAATAARGGIVLLASLALASLSWHFLERRFLEPTRRISV